MTPADESPRPDEPHSRPETLAQIEERICSCGSGHGSGEGHTGWCDFTDYQALPNRPAEPLRCAECDCEGGGTECNWMTSPTEPAQAAQVDVGKVADLVRRPQEAADSERDCAVEQDFWHEELLREAADALITAAKEAPK